MNQTLGRPLVRALRARAGILLLINQLIFSRGSESLWAILAGAFLKLIMSLESLVCFSEFFKKRAVFYF